MPTSTALSVRSSSQSIRSSVKVGGNGHPEAEAGSSSTP
jgi:hypothetical protein